MRRLLRMAQRTSALSLSCVSNRVKGANCTLTIHRGDHRAKSSTTTHWDAMLPKTRNLASDLLQHPSSLDSTAAAAGHRRRRALSQAITLVESKQRGHQEQAALLLTHVSQQKIIKEQLKRSFRVGIAGPPGAGKSTFVEALGKYILAHPPPTLSSATTIPWHPARLAVICIDPSSIRSGGSILGDKTRMPELSRHERAYVRPEPTAGALGGLAAYTDDVVLLCHAAGYELALVETVGLGQSEIEVAQSVDMLLLLLPPGGGDDLQGVKKGIVEVAHAFVVTKADGNLHDAARQTAADYKHAVQFLQTTGRPPGMERPKVLVTSSVTNRGLDAIWQHICDYRQALIETDLLEQQRRRQSKYWMWRNLQNLVLEQTETNADLRRRAEELETQLASAELTPRVAAQMLLKSIAYYQHKDQ